MSNLLKLENLNYYFKTQECPGSKNQEATWTARCPSNYGFAAGFNIDNKPNFQYVG